MKKFWKTLMFALVGVFALSSCEDVPAPYPIPDAEGGEDTPIVNVDPTGDGTLVSPYNVAAALELISAMESDVESDQAYYIKGKVASNNTTEATISQYGNMTFTIYDEGNPSKTFTAFQVYGPGNKRFTSVDQIKVGDEVVVYGKVVNYRGNTPETVGKGKAYVYSINDGGGGEETPASSKENPLTVSQAKTASGNNYVKGYIVGYIDGQKLTEGAKFSVPSSAETEILLAETPDETNPNNVFPVQLPAGDIRNALELSAHPDYLKKEVLLYGSLETYFGVPGMKSTSWASIEGQTFGKDPEGGDTPTPEPTGTPEGDGTKASPWNVAAVTQAYYANNNFYDTNKEYYVKGIVTEVAAFNDKYGSLNYYIADEVSGTNTFYVYSGLGLDKAKFTGKTDLKVGDEVVVCGKFTVYQGTFEFQYNNYLVSLNGKTNGGGDTPGPQPSGDVSGSGTENDPYNVAAAISVYNASTTASGVWVKGYIVGYIEGQVITSGSKFTGTGATVATNVLLADNANETDYTKCIPVQLPTGNVRSALNLVDNPSNYKVEVSLYGNIEKYFGVAGLKTVTKYVLGEGGQRRP